MRHYTQLTEHQRYQIQALMKAGHLQAEMAGVIGVHKSTVSREVRRNRGLFDYRPNQAQQLAHARRQNSHQSRIAGSTWRHDIAVISVHEAELPAFTGDARQSYREHFHAGDV